LNKFCGKKLDKYNVFPV